MRTVIILLALLVLAAGCAAPASLPNAAAEQCADAWRVADRFYDANDAGNAEESAALLTDDVLLARWASGVQGYLMSSAFTLGKTQVRKRLDEPGLRRVAAGPGLPNYQQEGRRQLGNVLRFELAPDRPRPNGRAYNPFSVELVLNRCQIEIIRVVERVTWL